MQFHTSLKLISLVVALLGAGACERAPAPSPAPPPGPDPHATLTTEHAAEHAVNAGLKPLPAVLGDAPDITEAKVELGKMLFFDKRLSVNGTQSCNTCHALGHFGVDSQPTSLGATGTRGTRNSPTVLNAAGHFAQFWDARSPNVEEQAKGPILNPIEMGMKDDKAVVDVVSSIAGYRPKFEAAFPGEEDPITFDNYANAVGAFERKLVTPARLDAFLNGDASALSDEEKKGLVTFMQAGCIGCHSGAFLGGAMAQKLGISVAWPNQKDVGRASITKADADKMFFKVPSLRNVDKTGPYFHDGSVKGIDDAVRLMAKHQLGAALTDEQVASIVAFLKSTTAPPPPELAAEPVLP